MPDDDDVPPIPMACVNLSLLAKGITRMDDEVMMLR
jgi:hypothetical protein